MFMGEYRHSLDEKGRLFIPARFRERLGPSFVITRGLDGCLFLFPSDTWKVVEERLAALPVNRAASRAFSRLLFSGASECEPDRQGRILLPQPLRAYAGLEEEKEAVVVGVSQRVEIWSVSRWTAYTNEASADFAKLAEEMVDMPL
ncbi:MAG TPA: division/cell wall cluster transcriptional repressor MraZ [Firmicutes bacterium]|nr:division/cell wall cluster transcriptional repressor MraZ [Bacillota bacterium]